MPASNTIEPRAVLDALDRVLSPRRGFVGLHEPLLDGRESEYLQACLNSGYVSSVGEYVERFEKELAEYTGARRAVAVVNGTAALQVCLKLVGVDSDEEVLVPTLTFVATPNAVVYCGAIPHFVDSEERTLGLDPVALGDYLREIAELWNGKCLNRRTGRRIAAVVPMHTFAHPVDMDPLLELAERYALSVVEDATESLGSRYKGRAAGTMGRLGALSFNGNKIMTTGGGGAILTDDSSLADKAKHLTTTAKLPHRWKFAHDQVGFNYRMPNVNAALGCAQLEHMDEFVSSKRRLTDRYCESFREVSGARVFTEPGFAKSNYWLNALVLDECVAGQRDAVLELTNSNGIMTRLVWTPMHRLPMYANCPRMDLPVAENLERRVINVPSSAFLA